MVRADVIFTVNPILTAVKRRVKLQPGGRGAGGAGAGYAATAVVAIRIDVRVA